jgi:PST family polysaccharide transporter
MNLVRTSLLSLMSTSVKMLAGLIVGKAVALVSGPSGVATIGQFQNFVQIVLTSAKGGLDTGVTKYTAEYGSDDDRAASLFSTAFRLCACSCAIVSLVLLIGATPLAVFFLGSPEYGYILRLFGLTLCMFVANSLLLAIVNGLNEIRTFIVINIVQSLLTLLLTIVFIAWLGLAGALIALVTNQSLVLFVLLWWLRGHSRIHFQAFRHQFGRDQAILLIKFSAMTTVSAIASPVTAMLVRGQVMSQLGENAAGYWQAMWYIATVYLTVVTTSLSVYYLPKLSATSDPTALRQELKQGFLVVMPIVICSALTLYLARELIVQILFTEAFRPMLRLFGWMLVGDIIKMASWLLSYLMLAKAMTRAFVATELIFSASFVALAYGFIRLYGFEGVAIAYAANYVLYLAAVALITKRFWLPVRS